MLSLCRLCGDSGDELSLTCVRSDKGKVENIEYLLDQYITPILLLPKDDKLCVCDTCKTRLQTWDAFIESCRKTQERLKPSFTSGQNSVSSGNGKRGIDSAGTCTDQTVLSSFVKKKKSSNYCIARWCNMGNYQGVSLFRLPRDRDRALIWLSAADRCDLECMTNLHSYYLCANHFTFNMFTNKAYNQLIRGAVPTLFPRSPYADKTPVKKATSPTATTQLQGVKFKSILPKVSFSNNDPVISSSTYQEAVEISTDELKTEKKWNSVVHVLPHMPISNNQFSAASGHDSNVVLKVISSKPNSILYSTKDSLYEMGSDRLPLVIKCSTLSNRTKVQGPLESPKNQVLFKITNQKPNSATSTKEGCKQRTLVLQDIVPCVSTDELSLSALPSVGSSIRGTGMSQSLKEDNNSPVSESSHIGVYSKNLDSHVNEHNVCDPYESIVGSQDVLLPHVSKSRILTADSREQTFMLMSASSHVVPTEGNSLLSNTTEINAGNTGLFDLRADEMQGTHNATFSNMVNLDELMDLDHYFNR